MIIVKLMGGLGNQLFQYAAGRAAAEKHDLELLLDMAYFTDKHEMIPRPFELDKLQCQVKFATRKEVDRVVNRSRVQKSTDFLLGYRRIYQKENQPDPVISGSKKTTIYLDGYWQAENYFKQIEQQIRSEFTFRAPFSSETGQLAGKIRETPGSVSVHIRRGDYLGSEAMANYLGVCSIDYYNKALEYISGKVGQIYCYVFGDDPEWIKENIIQGRDNMQAVTHNRNADSWQDMYLMSLCRHHIIANSSFSWWGTWLDPRPDKIVVAPETWFKSSELYDQIKNIVPDGWIRM